MSNNMEKTSFEKHTGKKSRVKILEENIISEGTTFGEIYETLVDVGGRKKKFIIKKYQGKDSTSSGEFAVQFAKEAFENYSYAKKAGLKVFPTFRLSQDKKNILMTNGNLENQICIGANHYKNITDFERPLIKNIDNLDNFLKEYFEEGFKINGNNFQFHHDVPFFLISKTEPIKLDFVLGDLDNLTSFKNTIRKDFALNNIHQMRKSIADFTKRNIDPSYQDIFFEKLEYYYKKAMYEVEKSDLKYDPE